MVGPSRCPGSGIGLDRQWPVRPKAIDPSAGAGAGGVSLRGAIHRSRQDGVHIQRGCILILIHSDGMDWQANGELSLTNSENRKLQWLDVEFIIWIHSTKAPKHLKDLKDQSCNMHVLSHSRAVKTLELSQHYT